MKNKKFDPIAFLELKEVSVLEKLEVRGGQITRRGSTLSMKKSVPDEWPFNKSPEVHP